MSSTQMVDRLLTAPEIAERLRFSLSHTYRLMATGELPTLRLGGARRVRESALEAWLEERES